MTAWGLRGAGLWLLLLLLALLVAVAVAVLPVLLIALGALALPLLLPPLPLLVALPLPLALALPLPPLPLPLPVPLPLALALSVLPLSLALALPVIVVRFRLCILHPEVLILPTTPEPLYFIVIIRICIRLKCCVSDISRDPIVPISESFIFFVKLPFIFTNGHCKPFLLKIGLLFFSNGCFF